MKIGFIGTGAVAEAMIEGLCGAAGHRGPIVVTQRSEARSARLAGKYANVTRTEDTQALVDGCDLVVVAVLPKQAAGVLSELSFHPDHHVLSVVAGLSLDKLRGLVAPASRLQRALPMPPMERGLGPLPLCPPDADTEALFTGTGDIIAVEDEHRFDALASGSAVMASFFELVARTARWIERQGVPRKEASLYARSLFRALSVMAHEQDEYTLPGLAEECQTPGGLNEQVIGHLRDAGLFEEVDRALDGILRRLEGR